MSCAPDKIVFDSERGEFICTETGEVLEDRVVDQGMDWRAYNAEQFMERARAFPINPSVIINSGFLPTIGIKPKNIRLSNLYSAESKPLLEALRFLVTAVQKIGGNDAIRQEASRILQKLWGNKHLRYLGHEIVVLVSIYIAYRKLRILMPFDEYVEKVWEIYKISPKQFTSAYFEVLKYFDEKIPNFAVEDFVKECGLRLGLPIELIEKALNFSKEIEKSGIFSGRSPKVVACTILYYLAKNDGYTITQPDIDKKCGVTASALRMNTRIIRKYAESILNNLK
ncbi:putative transcription initiation factor B [Metallosphaera rod-shaped virus 1]|uniref:Putative transcription initiation factor B n=1 Tax=Metallosphaera rod-shaped virus 1 TaxID=2730618 RepID=A0A6M3VZQ7_9VIRU|nr:putative transcription initiation factor B [Metallosphaera rod-shaped virus 1]QJF12373.1 putative transcription initiation factor B [Metallosphaera rod-shaped virus 1]